MPVIWHFHHLNEFIVGIFSVVVLTTPSYTEGKKKVAFNLCHPSFEDDFEDDFEDLHQFETLICKWINLH